MSPAEDIVTLSSEIRPTTEDVKRHLDEWVEVIRDDLRALAIQLASLHEKVDRLTPPLS